MRRRTRQTLAALLSMVLLLCLAPASFAADAIDLTKLNTVKINLVSSNMTEYEEEIKTAGIQADLYLITEAEPVTENGITYDTYSYRKPLPKAFTDVDKTLQDDLFAALTEGLSKPDDQDAVNKKFAPLAKRFAKIILDAKYSESTSVPPVAEDGKTTTIQADNLKAGLYLLVLRGEKLKKDSSADGYITTMPKKDNTEEEKTEEVIATRALSSNYEFFFEPQLLTVPTRTDKDGQQLYNTAYGEWAYTLEVTVKPDYKPRNGKLILVKKLDSYVDLSTEDGSTEDGGTITYYEPATFTFDVIVRATEKESDPPILRRQVTINMDHAGDSEPETVEGIPIGSFIWVEEVYSGSHYTGGALNPATYPQQLLVGEDGKAEITVTFSNSDIPKHRGGHGIENVFTYGDNGWVFSTNPGGEHTKDDLSENGKVVVTS